jgi:hypothetical protein
VREIPLNSERYYTHNDRDENYGTREEEEEEKEEAEGRELVSAPV